MRSYECRRQAQAELRINIRQAARDRDWTLTRLSAESSVPYSKLTQGLSAARWLLRDEVAMLAAAFEMTVSDLMGDSVFKEDAPGSSFDQPAPPSRHHSDTIPGGVGTGRGRALCCECGVFRRFRTDEVDYRSRVHDGLPDALGRRMTLPLDCRVCGRETTHAELRTDTHRNYAEEVSKMPTRDQLALKQRDELIDRMRSFNVDVHLRQRGAKGREKGHVARYEYDESKSQWRVEVDPTTPGSIQLEALSYAWKCISTGDFNGIDWDPKDGVVFGGSAHGWRTAVDDLVEEIHRATPLERERMRLDVVDQIHMSGEL